MYDLKWIKFIILMGVIGCAIGYFVIDNIELGLITGLAVGVALKTYKKQANSEKK